MTPHTDAPTENLSGCDRISIAGATAARLLSVERHGEIFGSHAKGVYCRFTGTDAILLLHDDAYGEIPFGAGCPGSRDWRAFPKGSLVHITPEQRQLLLDDTLFMMPATPQKGEPTPLLDSGRNLAVFAANREAVRAAIMRLAEESAIQTGEPFIRIWLENGMVSGKTWTEPWHDELATGLAELAARLPHGTPAELAAPARHIIGLGPGLTPLGDDILCGILYGMHALKGFGGTVPALAHAVADLPLATLTTPQSVAMLRAAAAGERFALVENAIHALPSYVSGLHAPMLALLAVGHSSGGGLMAGICRAVTLCG